MRAKYINPFTDFGFKKIFGEEASKPLLMDFLNALLPVQDKIVSLDFKNTENLGRTALDRKAVYDIYCQSSRGERFIVELQKARQNYFKERTVYYSTFPIREQAEKGDWNYDLKAVYCVGILDFTFDDYETEPEQNEVVHTIKLKDQYGKVFYHKLTYIYLEMPNFQKAEGALETRLDQWLYFIKHLEDFQTIPAIFSDDVFTQAFEKAELAKFSPVEMDSYEASLKVFRDNKATFDYAMQTAREEALAEGKAKGLAEGLAEGKAEGLAEGVARGLAEGLEKGVADAKKDLAKKMKMKGLSAKDIAEITGLSEAEIDSFQQDTNCAG